MHLEFMETIARTSSGLEPLMSIEELSEYLHVPVRTLYDWRLAGKRAHVPSISVVSCATS